MNKEPLKLYRKRLIPAECILLKDDTIVAQNDNYIVTKWNTLHPKAAFRYGCSCYFLKEGYKVSKFYRHDGSLLYWYCDIVDYDYQEFDHSLIVTDLLADVILYPDGRIKITDLDELADSFEQHLLTQEQLLKSLRQLNNLLSIIYCDQFDQLQEILNRLQL